jgi:hypothetical protein
MKPGDEFREATAIAVQLTTIKARLGALGLLKTMHALDEATRAIGYEIAEHMEKVELPERLPLEPGHQYHARIRAAVSNPAGGAE